MLLLFHFQDIGQKDFGHVKCDTCGMVYTKNQEEDEEQHAKYHQRIVRKLRFNVRFFIATKNIIFTGTL